ncbi:hypothetical protein [Mesorhizobium amorphae]|uniref:hypothetical protein n=1 Tax=Mesorhizobium amorphae TaxID=71433 RepID=UPI001FEF0472|nr:hypothetical protein [Mesorhizobium amorphae]
MVQAIVRSIRCELRHAVTTAVNDDIASAHANKGKTYSDFLDNWGAQLLLTLTVVEKSTLSPSVNLMPPSPASSVLNVAAGGSLSSQATRTEKMNFFYTVKELYLRKGEECDASGEERQGSLLVKNDLKIASILTSRINTVALGQARAPAAGKPNVLSHQITFQIVSSGNITPSWRLVRATINPSGSLFNTSRDRTQDLVITFGPLDKAQGGKSLIAIAEQAHFASQLASGVSSGFKAALPQ